MTDHITVADQANGVRLIVMDRPQKKNALTGAMYDAMRLALEEADRSPEIRAVVFAGQPGMFSAGNDLSDFLAGAGAASAIRRPCASSASLPGRRLRWSRRWTVSPSASARP